ncbi:MAG: class I SAM-dependent rRNA methyltransferase [Bacteroidia bacterium]|nr:class I SAM-dependent rRNA methyltransferase [Bacteroidia bacterium]
MNNTGLPKVILGSGKDQSLRRFHPWVFSGAIRKINGEAQEGDLVEVYSDRNEYLGTGHYQDGSIAVRIISFSRFEPGAAFWRSKIKNAYDYRASLGLTANPQTNVYRLVYAEGDGLPGLIVDYYNSTAVVQAHSLGMHRHRQEIAEALKEVYGEQLKAVYDKSKESLAGRYAEGLSNGYLYGSGGNSQVSENGNLFSIDWEEGQKTGFFIDQRENRKLVSSFAAGRKVLDCFCYAGGFSVYAMKGGAAEVHSVDSSNTAIKLTDRNIALNFGEDANQTSHPADVFDYLKGKDGEYDMIIVDPPAFAKRRDARHHAVMGYKRLNALAIKSVKAGGIIFTFSCSQVVDRNLFNGAVTAAAIEAGRNVRIMQYLSQPPDHPVSIFHPEGEYLKGLMLYVD